MKIKKYTKPKVKVVQISVVKPSAKQTNCNAAN